MQTYLLCFSVLCLLCLCTRLFICALWLPTWKGLTSWLSFVVSYCEFVEIHSDANLSFMFFCLVFAMPLYASVCMCLVVTYWERADLLALVCGVLL